MEENEITKQVIYTNSIGIEASIFDVKLKIDYNTTSEKGETEKYNMCEIAMSPQHAKAFSKALSNTIKEYENNFGEIKLSTIKKEGK